MQNKPEEVGGTSGNAQSRECLNILVMGPTGAGKSTWINAFVNYSNFLSFENAVLHTKSSYSESNLLKNIGENNKLCNPSDTAKADHKDKIPAPSQCSLTFEGTPLQLIDTPGILDCRNEHVVLNVDKILSDLKPIKELHCICVILRQDDERITIGFRVFIAQLLAKLPQSAFVNIVFCFTHTRATFYRPGSTMSGLRSLIDDFNKDKTKNIELSKNNVFCFDSESMRFLATFQNHLSFPFSEEETKSFAHSWEISKSEARRLCQYIQSRRPLIIADLKHDMKNNQLMKHQAKAKVHLVQERDQYVEATNPVTRRRHFQQSNPWTACFQSHNSSDEEAD